MWFLGKKGTFLWGNYHFWVMNDHLWGPSVHVDKSFTKIQARVRPPPFRQWLYFGSFCSGNPSLNWTKNWAMENEAVQHIKWISENLAIYYLIVQEKNFLGGSCRNITILGHCISGFLCRAFLRVCAEILVFVEIFASGPVTMTVMMKEESSARVRWSG